MSDMTCLADGMVFPADFKITGINLNEIIVGPTGCGKSFSTAYPRLLHTTQSSVVVPIAKGALKKRFLKLFRERGYEVLDLDFTHPESCRIGYDPMFYIQNDEDVINTARNLMGLDEETGKNGNIDPYWMESATSIVAAEIGLVLLNAKESGKRASFVDVIKLHRSIRCNPDASMYETNVDCLFEKAQEKYPYNVASEQWKTMQGIAPRTASCIFSMVNNAYDKIFSNNVLEMIGREKVVNFRELGEKKIALFITTSPMNLCLQRLVNLMYADMFKELFELAESKEEGCIDIPVHIICDDFACCGKIEKFSNYISIFRAAGISVTLLIQSETQLSSMYGDEEATTIINNCDTYVYMGGMDLETCKNISQRSNKPVDTVMSLPLEQVIVFRRGSKPTFARRYQTLADPIYRELVKETEEERVR